MFTNDDKNVTENRHIYIGGSDIPTILGINKYMTAYQLARQKAGIDKSDFVGNMYTEFGNILEPQIRDYINAVNQTEFYPDTIIDKKIWARGNCDGLDRGQNLLLEIKTHGKSLDTKTYIPQMQLYMYLFGLESGWLALYERPSDFNVEFDADRLQIQVIEKDEGYINQILDAIESFRIRTEFLKDNPGASEFDFYNNEKTPMLQHEEKMYEKSKGGSVLTNNMSLAVKTIEFEPAKVEFNYAELEAILDENLKKYSSLTFTEKEAAECRKTITELRKGKKALDDYRKSTKKQLTESVTAFENQCKDLNKKFDEVINPLVEQNETFEEKRKEEKRVKVQEILDTILEEFGLDGKHAAELVIEDSYLTKSKTLKSITEELTTLAEHLKMKQDKLASDVEIIKSHVELMNAKHELNLIESTYINLLDYQEFQAVRDRIESDAEEVLKQRELEERQRKAKEHANKVIPPKVTPEQQAPDEEVFLDVYEVIGTESQLDALEVFMNSQGIEFKILEEETQ